MKVIVDDEFRRICPPLTNEEIGILTTFLMKGVTKIPLKKLVKFTSFLRKYTTPIYRSFQNI